MSNQYKTELIRFHSWLFDRSEINFAKIESVDGKDYSDFEEAEHSLIISLKNGSKFNLICHNKYMAIKELDHLTSKTDPYILGEPYNVYLAKTIHLMTSEIRDLDSQIRKLMNSYKKKNKSPTKDVK